MIDRLTRRAPLFLLCAVLLAAVGYVASMQQGEDLLIQRKYAEAATALADAERTAAPELKERILFLRGRAELLAGNPEAAIATFQRLVDGVPGTSWRSAARFQEAIAHERAGRLREAAEIHRAEVQKLIGLERKEEVAATYLALADRALGADPVDHAAASGFLDLALDLGLPEAKARAVRLRAASSVLAAGNAADAVQRLLPLVRELGVAEGKHRAMLLLGQARRAAGDNPGARAVLRDLRNEAPETPEAADAAWEIALSFGVPTPAPGDLDRAVQALRELAARHPAHPKARIASLLVAQCQAHCGRTASALGSLEEFLADTNGAPVDEVAAARAMRGDVLAAQGRQEDAIAAWRDYLAQHPAHAAWERVQRAIVDMEFAIASRAVQEGKPGHERARERLAAFSRAYPLDERNPDILATLGDMLLAEERYDEASEAYGRCVSKYPGKDASSRAQYQVGVIHETKKFDYERALAAYRAVTWGPFTGHAQARIAALTKKQLHLVTERTFRTDEKAVFRITSRNIEKVRVRVFRLDLEDYFRATHTAGEVQRLDIEVIQADRTFDSVVPEYVKHRETTRDVEIGLNEPGAYVVKVDDRELEATAMVLVSDLAMITKASRTELLVFTQHVREDRAEAGVRVIVSDGKKVVSEGVTGPDGTWRWRSEELQKLEDLVVFAVNARGSGASSVGLGGLGFGIGIAAKGYLFTDRPACEPGESVHLKAIVREVEGGMWKLPREAGWRFRALGSDGRVVAQQPVVFGAFGTFSTRIDVPAGAAVGTWSAVVEREDGSLPVFRTTFEVARYERPRLQLAFELEQQVVFRGEPIVGRVKAMHFFGGPAANLPIACTMRLPDGSVAELRGTTTAAGELPVRFETREFAEEGMAVLDAELPGENVRARLVVPVVVTEFTPSVRTVRNVYLTGESFEARLMLLDRAGKPVARKADIVLLRIESQRGTNTEVEVARVPVTTGGNGEAVTSLTAPKGGLHCVRAEARDRFGNLVTGEAFLSISGDDDTVKLRLLCDRDTFTLGERIPLRIVNRAGPRLALLTWQGDGILACRAERIEAGDQLRMLELEAMHAPNFAFAVAMVDGNQLHEAQRDFVVGRELKVRVEVPAEARPGEDVEVVLEARDSSGAPAAAELALAMVDEALLAIHPDQHEPLGAFFQAARRETAFRTASSCTWNYRGQSRPVSADLLAEERRRDRDGAQPGAPEAERAAGDVPQQQSAFDSNQWNSAVGLGGGGGGRFGGRNQREAELPRPGGGRGSGGPATPGPGGPATGGPGGPVQLFAGLPQLAAGAQTIDLNGFGQSRYHYLHLGSGGWQNEMQDPTAPRIDFRALGAWVPAILTDATGRAVTKVRMPDSTTGWAVRARGVTAGTDAGEGSARLQTRKQLQVSLIGPLALTEGDTTTVSAEVRNQSGAEQQVAIAFGPKGAADPVRTERTLAAGGTATIDHVLAATEAVDLERVLSAASGPLRDEVHWRAGVRPFGIEAHAGRSGTVRDREAFELSLPTNRAASQLRLSVEVGPDPGRDLVTAALGAGFLPRNQRITENSNLSRASRGLAALVALDYLERSGASRRVDMDRLQALAQASVTSLGTDLLRDGGFAWAGKAALDVRTTAQAVRFLAMARRRGLTGAEDLLNGASEALLRQLGSAAADARADMLHALAASERARFEALNTLHRSRNTLGTRGLAQLGLAWFVSRRPELAAEALATLKQRAGEVTKGSTESLALAAQLAALVDPRDVLVPALAEEIRKRRSGAGWETIEATAAAVGALALLQGEVQAASATEVVVRVNGEELARVRRGAERTRFDVPAAAVKARGNQVEIRVEGGGTAWWSADLTGFLQGFVDADRNLAAFNVDRSYQPAPLRRDGKVVPSGFTTVRGSKIRTFRNQLTQLHKGEAGVVTVTYSMPDPQLRGDCGPVVVEEPIPAGCSVPRDSVAGSFDAVEVLPDRLLVFFRSGLPSSTFRYELQARFPGTYRALPTRVQDVSNVERLSYGTVGQLKVHADADQPRDPYRLTPDELYYLGKAEFDAAQRSVGEVRIAQLAAAGRHFDELLAEWHREDCLLSSDVFREVARMMLFLSIERGDAKSVVRFFEELKERYPDLVIPFDRIVAVGRSYFDLGEFESALLVFRATAEASFLKDAAVAAVLESRGEVRESALFLQKLLQVHPDLPTMRASRYGVAQKLAALAAGMDPAAATDRRVGSIAEVRAAAIAQLREFLVLCPEDPLAEEVSFAWASTCLEGKDVKSGLAVAQAALDRYPGSAFTDEFLYATGYSQFALGEHDAAFRVLQRVATEQFTRPDGSMGPSESAFHATYLQGQIHHARGEPALALAAYEKVKDRFSDAAEAADFFLQQALGLPEVATFAMADKPRLALSFRNVAKASVQVFRVDLMRLYLMEKSLNDIRGIQLHGIKPLRSLELELGDGRDYRMREQQVDLDLPEPGAYLVVVRGGNLIASGMVLRSDLKVDVQESFDTGRVRVNVKQADSFVGDAHVKVVGSGDQQVRSGDTDLRGISVADGVVGQATVLVQKGEQFAFHRGTGVHQPQSYRGPADMVPANKPARDPRGTPNKDGRKFDALEQQNLLNTGNRSRQVEWLNDNVGRKQQQGVEVFRTK